MSYSVCSRIGNQDFISTLLLLLNPLLPRQWPSQWLLCSRDTFLHRLELGYWKEKKKEKKKKIWVPLVAEREKVLSERSRIQWKRDLGSGHYPTIALHFPFNTHSTKYISFWTRNKVLFSLCECLSKQLIPTEILCPFCLLRRLQVDHLSGWFSFGWIISKAATNPCGVPLFQALHSRIWIHSSSQAPLLSPRNFHA